MLEPKAMRRYNPAYMDSPTLPPAVIEPKPQTVVIVTALDVETKAVLRHLGNDWTDETVQGTVFYRGTFETIWSVPP